MVPCFIETCGLDTDRSSNFFLQRRRERVIVAGLLAVIAGFYAACVVYCLGRIHGNKADFDAFYFAARAMRAGEDMYVVRQPAYIYPPLVALLYLPLAWLNDVAAGAVAMIVNVLASMLSVWLIASESARRVLGRASRVAALVLAGLILLTVGDKIRADLRMWQTNVLLIVLVAGCVALLDKRPRLAGMLAGLAVNIKYLPIALLGYFIIRRRWKAAGGMVGGILLGAFLPALVRGWSRNLSDLGVAFNGVLRLFGAGVDRGADIDDIRAEYSVSITSFFARQFAGSHTAAFACGAAVAIAAAVFCGVAYRRAGRPVLLSPRREADPLAGVFTLLEISWLWGAMLIFSPQTNPRHLSTLTLLVGPVWAFIIDTRTPKRDRLVLIGTMAFLWLSLVLPPGGEMFDPWVRRWRELGGPGWCMLVFILVSVQVIVPGVMGRVRAEREAEV